MTLNLPTFYKRTGSAIVFGIIMLTGLLWNNPAFLVLVCVIDVLCLREYFRLMQRITPDAHWPAWIPPATFAISLGVMALLISGYIPGIVPVACQPYMPALRATLALCPVVLLLLATLFQKNGLVAIMQAAAGVLYISLPMAMLFLIRLHGATLPLALILMIWCNDTMAYLVGSFIGKTPFSPISPKKTWEGTGGGALLTVAAAVAYGYFSHQGRMTDWIALALCAAVAGTVGDLLESKLKRMADVKDSGTMMPGHGGALDRFDSLIVATPFAFVYVYYFM